MRFLTTDHKTTNKEAFRCYLPLPPPFRHLTMASSGPDLKKYMGKMVGIKLNNNRQVRGMLAGYDQFMNLVLDEAVQVVSSSEQRKLGQLVIRGNSVIRLEHLGKKWAQEEAAKQ